MAQGSWRTARGVAWRVEGDDAQALLAAVGAAGDIDAAHAQQEGSGAFRFWPGWFGLIEYLTQCSQTLTLAAIGEPAVVAIHYFPALLPSISLLGQWINRSVSPISSSVIYCHLLSGLLLFLIRRVSISYCEITGFPLPVDGIGYFCSMSFHNVLFF